MSGLFASLVMQQTNMALMMLGKTPPPEGAPPFQDLEAARVFIDQLEMIESKTRGNLTKDEETLLKQNLTALRMAFVETVESQDKKGTGGTPAPSTPASGAASSPASDTSGQPPSAGPGGTPPEATGADDEHRKKFSKKY